MIRARLQEKYRQVLVPELKQKLDLKSVMQVPRLLKICINQGVGVAVTNKKLLEVVLEELGAITGQKAVKTKAKKSVSNFKLRVGMPIGAMVTLRSKRMYEFLDRLVTLSLPRVRDFRGISPKGFDGRGNYNLGIREQIVFPEISVDKVSKVTGMNITFVTSAREDHGALQLLRALGMPFRER